MAPSLYWLAKKGWLPVTEHMKKRVEAAKERELKEEKQRERDKLPKPGGAGASAATAVPAAEYDDIESTGLPKTEDN